jgi:hypothetical protein
MQADLPHTLYNRRDKKKKGGSKNSKPFHYNSNDPAIARQAEANRRAAERRAAKARGEVPYTMDELFKK